ncbi:LacI family transcriptional regulator [Agrobacterium rhizogenes]|nr:LacI family transcriptional regulator [Rhizobium rhizogenes]NTI97716.1 LacI family transcriptional regulator [Rhizobium rhizogenes]NTJ60107.1 LacI family transcriptional regulator [Rhizobium rhizogenes]OCJ19451.1 transcriptional regulator [Agrobacterium sp. B133/95]
MKRRQPVSIKTVAERAGVSPATVSNVLNAKPSVAPKLIERVRSVVAELGYVTDSNASRLRSGKHSLAGVVVPDLSNPMFGTFVSTLETLAREDGFDLLVVSAANDVEQEKERLHAIRSWRPAGLIVIPCDGALSQRTPSSMHMPIVVVDRLPDDPDFDLIAVNNAQSAAAISAHLSEQGYRSCTVAGSMLSISNIRERWEGAASAAGGMALSMLEVGLEAKGIRQRLHEILTLRRPEALFALDHITALIAYQTMTDLGLSAPGDLAFACFDEAEWMRLVRPAITTVRQPIEEMATAAWQQLSRRMGGNADPVKTLRLACSVEVRGSTLREGGQSSTAA